MCLALPLGCWLPPSRIYLRAGTPQTQYAKLDHVAAQSNDSTCGRPPPPFPGASSRPVDRPAVPALRLHIRVPGRGALLLLRPVRAGRLPAGGGRHGRGGEDEPGAVVRPAVTVGCHVLMRERPCGDAEPAGPCFVGGTGCSRNRRGTRPDPGRAGRVNHISAVCSARVLARPGRWPHDRAAAVHVPVLPRIG